jgi:hypothetical protein
MQRAALFPIRFALFLSILVVPACLSLPKADVTRVIDDFAPDAGLVDASLAATGLRPTWDVFGQWTCDAFVIPDLINGNAGPDGGSAVGTSEPLGPDGGPPVICAVGPGEATFIGGHALAATIDLAASSRTLGVAVTTHAVVDTVDLTGFQTFQFDAWLHSENDSLQGALLTVELGCRANKNVDFVADQVADTVMGGAAGFGNQVRLKLADFVVTLPKGPLPDGGQALPQSEDITQCLRTVDSISFRVAFKPGTNTITGKLLLDSIEVTTKPK